MDTPITPTPVTEQSAPTASVTPSAPTKSSGGTIIAAIIIIILVILGGLYVWGARLNETPITDELPLIPAQENAMTDTSMVPVGSDAVSDISADIENSAAELDAMNADIENALDQIDAELGASR